ncbi:hypothetical protein KHA94_04300 [Bacillus sp. FJAT-49705]|uniref:Uncharacterized protein n=1 Tax=Cytobacillus citreus TaxID=2833586 RepID=A0ABS5NNQ7_9BACI|nr:hypothetical protein [Cytobacillus citreus]MBS4189440.1 hypothetical protein [Cytobacillus citreus]
MSEFMKNVVKEVLKPTQKPKENPLFGSETKFLYTNSIINKTAESKQNQTIQGISRPNYQLKNLQKRLSGISVDSPNQTENHSPKAGFISQSNSQSPRNIVEGSLSKLQALSLVQGNNSINTHHQANITVNRNLFNEESQFIGQSREGVKAWVFSGLHPNLLTSFQRSLKSNSIGVIVAEKCSVGQLFLLNDILREFSSIKYCLTWDKESKQDFVLELYEDQTEILTKAVKMLFQRLSQNSFKPIQVFKANSPGPWLTKQLGLKTHVDGAAVIEGIDYYSAILLLDRLIKKSPSKNFDYVIEKKYLLLYGNYEIVSQLSEELKNQAERFM